METEIRKHPENLCLYVEGSADSSLIRLAEETLKTGAVPKPLSPVSEIYLQTDEDGLALVENGRALRGDFATLLSRIVPNNLNRELLVKASRIKGLQGVPTAVDATAGLGEDAFLLAAAGFQVQLYERNPVIALLLYDALGRGLKNPQLAPVIGRMQLKMEDSLTALPQLTAPPDVVILDPMFPDRQKSGLIKKKFQLLQQLEQPCFEEEALLDAAVSCNPKRIVIKRPAKGPFLAGKKPSYSLKGNSIRYDCIVLPKHG